MNGTIFLFNVLRNFSRFFGGGFTPSFVIDTYTRRFQKHLKIFMLLQFPHKKLNNLTKHFSQNSIKLWCCCILCPISRMETVALWTFFKKPKTLKKFKIYRWCQRKICHSNVNEKLKILVKSNTHKQFNILTICCNIWWFLLKMLGRYALLYRECVQIWLYLARTPNYIIQENYTERYNFLQNSVTIFLKWK